MKIRSLLVWTCGIGVLILPAVCWAEDHRVCVQWTWLGDVFGFRDASPRPDVNITLDPDYGTFNYDEDAGEDYGRRDQPSDFAPRRMLAQVTDAGGVLWGWNFLDDEGCTGIFDTEASEVFFAAYPWSKWKSPSTENQVIILDCMTGDCELKSHGPAELSVSVGVQDILYDTAQSEIGYRFALHWAASFSEYRRAYHSGKTFYGALWSLSATINSAISNILVGGRPTFNIKDPPDPQRSKRTIAHEYGHLQTLAQVLDDPPLYDLKYVDYCYPAHCNDAMTPEDKFSHDFEEQEWQSAAALEGFADFYMMTVWNDVTGVGSIPRLPASGDETEIDVTKSDDTPTSYYGANYSGAGTAVQRDWAFFLWDLVTGSGPLDIDDVMVWLSGYWTDEYPWPAAAGSNDWWDGFEAYAKANPTVNMTESAKFDARAGGTGGRDVDQ